MIINKYSRSWRDLNKSKKFVSGLPFPRKSVSVSQTIEKSETKKDRRGCNCDFCNFVRSHTR